jgi:hypothetical protein
MNLGACWLTCWASGTFIRLLTLLGHACVDASVGLRRARSAFRVWGFSEQFICDGWDYSRFGWFHLQLANRLWDDARTTEQDEWTETTNTRTRIRAVILGLTEPAPVSIIADRAECSANAARTHLKEFVTLGVVRKHDQPTGTRYARNEAFVQWRRANERADSHTREELLNELASLETTAD